MTIEALVQQRQRAALARATERSRRGSSDGLRPSRWAHVPLGDLFVQYNVIYSHSDGTQECGHVPAHASNADDNEG